MSEFFISLAALVLGILIPVTIYALFRQPMGKWGVPAEMREQGEKLRILLADAEAKLFREEIGSSVSISIVMPCFNEEAGVADSVRKAINVLRENKLQGQVIVCDNGSTDSSADCAREAGAKVIIEPSHGYGNAYLSGVREAIRGVTEARGDVIVTADSDDTYDLCTLLRLIEPLLKDQADVVFGSRLEGQIEDRAMPWLHRHVGIPLLSRLFYLITGTRVSDISTGMRAFSPQAFLRMQEKLHINATGMEFGAEMIFSAVLAGLRVTEVPITYRRRRGPSKSKFRTLRDGFAYLILQCKYYLNNRREFRLLRAKVGM